jgi:hypothetical protein
MTERVRTGKGSGGNGLAASERGGRSSGARGGGLSEAECIVQRRGPSATHAVGTAHVHRPTHATATEQQQQAQPLGQMALHSPAQSHWPWAAGHWDKPFESCGRVASGVVAQERPGTGPTANTGLHNSYLPAAHSAPVGSSYENMGWQPPCTPMEAPVGQRAPPARVASVPGYKHLHRNYHAPPASAAMGVYTMHGAHASHGGGGAYVAVMPGAGHHWQMPPSSMQHSAHISGNEAPPRNGCARPPAPCMSAATPRPESMYSRPFQLACGSVAAGGGGVVGGRALPAMCGGQGFVCSAPLGCSPVLVAEGSPVMGATTGVQSPGMNLGGQTGGARGAASDMQHAIFLPQATSFWHGA